MCTEIDAHGSHACCGILDFLLNKLLMCGFEGTRKCNGSNFRYWLIRARMKTPLAR